MKIGTYSMRCDGSKDAKPQSRDHRIVEEGKQRATWNLESLFTQEKLICRAKIDDEDECVVGGRWQGHSWCTMTISQQSRCRNRAACVVIFASQKAHEEQFVEKLE